MSDILSKLAPPTGAVTKERRIGRGVGSGLGKTAGRDLDLRKSTYPAILGVEKATKRAALLVADGREALRSAGLLSAALDALAGFVVERRS